MKDTGYIKLHRKILDSPIVCKDSDYFSVWIYLLLNATHKEIPAIFKKEKIILRPGQLITGRISIANKLKISESKVKRILIELENDQQIDRQRSNKNSLISIINWEQYQKNDQLKEPTNDQQVTTNKNVKNIYLFLFNKYKEKIREARFSQRIKLMREIKDSNEYQQLTNKEQQMIYAELMSLK